MFVHRKHSGVSLQFICIVPWRIRELQFFCGDLVSGDYSLVMNSSVFIKTRAKEHQAAM